MLVAIPILTIKDENLCQISTTLGKWEHFLVTILIYKLKIRVVKKKKIIVCFNESFSCGCWSRKENSELTLKSNLDIWDHKNVIYKRGQRWKIPETIFPEARVTLVIPETKNLFFIYSMEALFSFSTALTLHNHSHCHKISPLDLFSVQWIISWTM